MAEPDASADDPSPEQDVLSAGVDARVEEENKRKILAFNVSHILVSLLFLWLLYEARSRRDSHVLTNSELFRCLDFFSSRKDFC